MNRSERGARKGKLVHSKGTATKDRRSRGRASHSHEHSWVQVQIERMREQIQAHTEAIHGAMEKKAKEECDSVSCYGSA